MTRSTLAVFDPIRIGGADEHRKVSKVVGHTRRVNSEVFSVPPVRIVPGGTIFKLKCAGGKILAGAHRAFGAFIVPEGNAPEILRVV